MSCDICGRGNCTIGFHSIAEQRRYEKVIDAFEAARDMRQKVRSELDDEEAEAELQERECSMCHSLAMRDSELCALHQMDEDNLDGVGP